MSVVTIRPATLQDAEGLAVLAERIFRETFAATNQAADMELYCAQHFGVAVQNQEIGAPNNVVFLAEANTQLVAFAQMQRHAPKAGVVARQPAELQRLYVDQAWQGRGVAHQLMSQVLVTATQAGADVIWLGVWEHNPRAIAFYGKYGFQVVGEQVFQLGNDPQRDLVMAAKLGYLFSVPL